MKEINSSICDIENYFPLQLVKVVLKIGFNNE